MLWCDRESMGKRQPTLRVESQCLRRQDQELLQRFIFRNIGGGEPLAQRHGVMSQNSWTLSNSAATTSNVPRVISFHIAQTLDKGQKVPSSSNKHWHKPYNSNRTPLEAPSTERSAPLCCSPSRHACWTWRQTTDCSIRRTIAGSFDTPYVKATGVGGAQRNTALCEDML